MNDIDIQTEKRGIESKIKKRIAMSTKELFKRKNRFQKGQISDALILHLDGDRRYTQKSEKYYRKFGLKAIVKNVPEYKQPQVIRKSNKKV